MKLYYLDYQGVIIDVCQLITLYTHNSKINRKCRYVWYFLIYEWKYYLESYIF